MAIPTRAERVSDFAEGLYKVNGDSPAMMAADGTGDLARFAVATHDGRATWIETCATLADARELLAAQAQEEYPFAPGDVLDLDTGAVWSPRLSIELDLTREPDYAGELIERVHHALRDAHRNDSAADAVEYVSDVVGWAADEDVELAAGELADA